MDESGFTGKRLEDSRVVIWGLGLMGGSLAMALAGKCAERIGIDADPAVVALALERGVVERGFLSPDTAPAALVGADLLVLAVPVRAILTLLDELPVVCESSLMVMDLGSTKAQIVAAMEHLPTRFDPLGGHPMCGKEKASLQHAEANLYQQAPFALVALERTSPPARRLGEELAKAIGSCPLWIEATQHDRWVAATSHAPFLLASALAQSTPLEAAPLIGPGFRSTARLAANPAEMMLDILATNSENVRSVLRLFRDRLEIYEALLTGGALDGLAEQLAEASSRLQDLNQGEKH
jgi:prephenate dehydrogenase